MKTKSTFLVKKKEESVEQRRVSEKKERVMDQQFFSETT